MTFEIGQQYKMRCGVVVEITQIFPDSKYPLHGNNVSWTADGFYLGPDNPHPYDLITKEHCKMKYTANSTAGGAYLRNDSTGEIVRVASSIDDLFGFSASSIAKALANRMPDRKIEAIQIYRAITKSGLREAKDAIEEHL